VTKGEWHKQINAKRKAKRKENRLVNGDFTHYVRMTTMTLEEGFALISNPDKPYIKINKRRVKVSGSQRLECFLTHGVKCVTPGCTNEGSFFAVEKHKKAHEGSYHLNLWGITEDGKEVLMTRDHRTPKMFGGEDTLENSQTMCCYCNWDKGVMDRVSGLFGEGI
jgi:hypothetical protein